MLLLMLGSAADLVGCYTESNQAELSIVKIWSSIVVSITTGFKTIFAFIDSFKTWWEITRRWHFVCLLDMCDDGSDSVSWHFDFIHEW